MISVTAIELIAVIALFLTWNIALIWISHKVTVRSGKHIRYINYELGGNPRPRPVPVIPDQRKAENLWSKFKKTEPEPNPVKVEMKTGEPPQQAGTDLPLSRRNKS